jgi:predicted dehydrogenase
LYGITIAALNLRHLTKGARATMIAPISRKKSAAGKVRYAVVGLGYIAQNAVLPAFKNAASNSVLTALVSSDPVKLHELGDKYHISNRYSYEDFDQCLQSGEVDAVYIALPNHLHCEYSVRAMEAGRHVLCEKPMAVTEEQCQRMIDAAAAHNVRLMIAYRLHFEDANLEAMQLVQTGQLGEPRFFQSSFSMQAREDGIRLRYETGGGTLYDIGIYCINAARCLFRAEPEEVFCIGVKGTDPRFSEVDEMSSAILKFPGDRLASFTSSFGAADVSEYRIVGTQCDLRLEPAYEYQGHLIHHLQFDGKVKKKTFSERDQFGPELIHFSRCILENRVPQPSGAEGMADVRIIEALYRSAREGRPIRMQSVIPLHRPSLKDEIHAPPVKAPELIHAVSPTL